MRFLGAATTTAFAAAALPGVALGQCDNGEEVVPGQHLGTPINNTLPVTHIYSEVTYFKVKDPLGEHICTDDPKSDFSLINYSSLNSTEQRPPNNAIQRAVIVCHGLRRDPQNYHAAVVNALIKATQSDPEISVDTVAVVAPFFPNGNDKGTAFPYFPDGEKKADRYPSPALVWSNTAWAAGAVNQYPPHRETVASYHALDQLLQWYGDTTRFPNMKQMVVAGHSLGAQLVQRYAAVGYTPQQLGLDVPVSWWVGDPNSMVWLSSEPPLSTGKCPTYDDYEAGYNGYDTFGADRSGPMTYNLELVAAGRDAVHANFEGKAINWGRASRDKGDQSNGDCAPYATGQDRNERFYEFIRAFPPSCEDPLGDNCDTVDIVESGHNAPTMFESEAGLARLFRDNWAGDGARAYDFGYPRRTTFDDPHPNPARAGDALLHVDSTVYAGNMTWRGCFTDVDNAQSVGSLPFRAYVGPLNSRTHCTAVCDQAGYTIAGISWEHCYCGNAVGSQTVEVVSTSCEGPCPGDSAQICGGRNRLSIFASGSLRP